VSRSIQPKQRLVGAASVYSGGSAELCTARGSVLCALLRRSGTGDNTHSWSMKSEGVAMRARVQSRKEKQHRNSKSR
jgi:hypothetical protein